MSSSLESPSPRLKKPHSSEAERDYYINEYLASDMSIPAFCSKHGLASSTFHSWLTKKKTRQQVASFIPVELNSHAVEQRPSQSIEVCRKGVKVLIPAITDIEAVIKLIRGLS
tara:strand:- start:70 stop:408 length:339 start_codon:yes stop_codon:yes gene_type:complete